MLRASTGNAISSAAKAADEMGYPPMARDPMVLVVTMGCHSHKILSRRVSNTIEEALNRSVAPESFGTVRVHGAKMPQSPQLPSWYAFTGCRRCEAPGMQTV